ncbi:MAG: hypothetical protein H6809_00035 [Phycisphaeraceae bacterium]|nr:hypothetical protein [Phycisphaeraceae bacterium]
MSADRTESVEAVRGSAPGGPARGASDPIERFLGPEAAAGGPFALLGVAVGGCNEAAIRAGFERQMLRVDGHPQGDTPEGEEVRIALHTAAAQLMDASVREQMARRWAGVVPTRSAPGAPAAGAASGVPGTSPVVASGFTPPSAASPHSGLDIDLQRDIRRTLAAGRGMNAHTAQQLAMLAKKRGLSQQAVPGLARAAMGAASGTTGAPAARTPGGPASASPPASISTQPRPQPASHQVFGVSATGGEIVPTVGGDLVLPRELDDDRAARTVKAVAALTILGIIAMAGAFWAVVSLTKPPASPPGGTTPARRPGSLIAQTPEPEPPEQLFPTRRDTPAPAPTVEAPPPDAGDLLARLRAAVEAQSVDPGAAGDAFRQLIDQTGQAWPAIPVDRRRALIDAIVEYVYRSASSPEGPIQTLEDVARGAVTLARARSLSQEQVAPAAWSVGLLVRLQRERDISARAGSLIESRVGAALAGRRPEGASAFEAGAAAALGAMPPLLVPSEQAGRTRESIDAGLDAWRAWLASAQGVTHGDAAARTALILAGMNVLLIDAPQPTDDRLVFEAIGLLAVAMDWSEGAAAREWLVRLIDAPGVSSGDVHAILSAVATQAPGARLDISLVPPARATDLERREIRDRLAILWNLADEQDRDALASAWREGASDARARRNASLTPEEHLASAVVLSRISEAAHLRWRGLTQEADDLLFNLDDDIEATLSLAADATGRALSDGSGDGVWAEQYLLAGRSIPIRIDLLTQAASRFTIDIGPVDAEVLVREAVRGSPPPVAQAAYDIVMRMNGSPWITNALLEELPTIPKTRRNTRLISALTGARLPQGRDDAWDAAARGAVVSRLLEILAADSDFRVFDDLSNLLAWSVMVRSDRATGPPAPGNAIDEPELAVSVLRLRWSRQAQAQLAPPGLGLTMDEVERRRASRLELAEGPVQLYAAEQLAATEMMALVVAAEQPDRTSLVRGVLDDLSRARQRARHIAEQIAAGEEAAVRLWGIRLKEPLP